MRAGTKEVRLHVVVFLRIMDVYVARLGSTGNCRIESLNGGMIELERLTIRGL